MEGLPHRLRRAPLRDAAAVAAVLLLIGILASAGIRADAVAQPPSGGDPVYSTFLGSTDFDDVLAIATDSSGHVYVAGRTWSAGFPTTAGALDRSFNGVIDAYVAKLSRDGSRLLFSTFLGGASVDEPLGIAIGPRGDVYVTGSTDSTDFPTTTGAFDTSDDGVHDGFVAKLSGDGSKLVYSSLLGGDSSDFAAGIAVDPRGDAYVTGHTSSADFPTTPRAVDRVLGAPSDAFVAKLTGDGSALGFSTFVGGAGDDDGTGIALDPRGSAYVIGGTDSPDFPTTSGAFDRTFGGFFDAFVVKLARDGSALGYATLLGGADGDIGMGIAVRPRGDAHLAGRTGSPDFPTTPGAHDRSYGGGFSDGFVATLAADGSALGFSTFLGGSFDDEAAAIAVDPPGHRYVTGFTQSSDFPITPGAFDAKRDFIDAFVTKLERDGSAPAYSTFLGGAASDSGHGIAADASGRAYVAGDTRSADFPTTPGAFDTTYGGGFFDGFVTVLATR
jgi:hypothetical protein